MSIKKNLHAFVVANRTYSLVKDFSKKFFEKFEKEDVDTQCKMYALCIKYMQEEFKRRFQS